MPTGDTYQNNLASVFIEVGTSFKTMIAPGTSMYRAFSILRHWQLA